MTNKLTAEECRMLIDGLNGNRSIREDKYLQALEIALPVLEQKEKQCEKCNGTGQMDSGGTQPWGDAITVTCDCQPSTNPQIDNDGWIEWRGGMCAPVTGVVEVRWSTGSTDIGRAGVWRWEHYKFMINIIAYRVIENDGREG